MTTEYINPPLIERVDTFHYSLVVDPGSQLVNLIYDEKRSYWIREEIDPVKGFVIASFTAKDSMEETLIRWIQRLSSQVKAFEARFNNYSAVLPSTIVLRIQEIEPIKNLASKLKAIDDYLVANGYPPSQIQDKLHIQVATGMPEEEFYPAMFHFSQRCFNAVFIVEELVLLREHFALGHRKTINRFRLYPPEINRE